MDVRRIPYPARRRGRRRAPYVLAVLLAATAVGCLDNPPYPFEPSARREPVDLAAFGALAWIGTYDGWGHVTVGDGERRFVSGLSLRIALDADSIKREGCPWCVTVTLEPWFVLANVSFDVASQAYLTYDLGSVMRSIALQRFSGGGRIDNALLVKLRHETPRPGGTVTHLDGDLEFRRR